MGKTAIPGAKRGTIFMMEPEALTIIGLDTKDDANHPLYDERINLLLDEGFILNIREHGVLENVIVRKNGDKLEVVAGRQRIRAAREVNARNQKEGMPAIRVPVAVRKTRSEGEALAVLVSENENRRDDDALTRAKKAQRLLNYGYLEEDIATQFGISTQAVKNLLALLDLSPKVQKAIASRKLAYSSALTLKDLPREEQDSKVDELIETGAGYAEARRQERIRKAKKNGEAPPADHQSLRGKAVKVKTLRKVAENEEFIGSLSPDAKHLLAWILGDEAAAKRIKGLTALLKD